MPTHLIAVVRHSPSGYWADVYRPETARRVPYLPHEGEVHSTHEAARFEAEMIVSRCQELVMWR